MQKLEIEIFLEKCLDLGHCMYKFCRYVEWICRAEDLVLAEERTTEEDRKLIMDAMKEGIQKRLSSRKKKKAGYEKGYIPQLSDADLSFIAEHTSINKEDVAET